MSKAEAEARSKAKARKMLTVSAAVVGVLIVAAGALAAWHYRDAGVIEDALSAEDLETRLRAIDELGHRSSDAAVEALITLSRDESRDIAVRALHVMGRSEHRERYQERIAEALTSGDENLRQAAVTAIGASGAPANVKDLERVLAEDRSPVVRGAAARMLGRVDAWDGFDALVTALDDGSLRVRSEAAGAIRKKLGRGFGYDPRMGPTQRREIISQLRDSAAVLRQAYEDYQQRKRGA